MRSLLVIVALLGTASCRPGGKEGAAPAVEFGAASCATCGMTVEEPRFAAAIQERDGIVVFDSIECLLKQLRRAGGTVPPGVWLTDFEDETLHPAGVMTVVAAGYPSPMGGGYAAFRDPVRARSEASDRRGVAGTLADFASGQLAPPSAP